MTSEPINIRTTLTLTAEGEAPQTLCETGQMLTKEDKVLLRLGERRIQIEGDRVLIRQGYQISLDRNKETPLDYPTPYGTLSMKVRTKRLEISPDRMKVRARYALYTNGERLHYVDMKLKTERI